MNRLKAEYGDDFDPVMKMSKNATYIQGRVDEAQKTLTDIEKGVIAELDEYLGPRAVVDLSKEANAEWDRVAKYTTPQLKSIEINLDADVRNHEGLPEVRERVDELLNGRTDPSSEGDLSD